MQFMSSKYRILIVIGLAACLVAAGIILKPETPELEPHTNKSGKVHKLVTYKSASCGCCRYWVQYMKAKDYKVETVDTEAMDEVKEKYDVPKSLYSCHTTIVNDGQYFIEGHIPEEAIAKLMEKEPPIKGIGMPGMPAASPGMPGKKLAPFDITQVDKNGKTSQFMSI